MAQTVIELPDELKSLAAERAAAAGVSLEEYVRRAVQKAVTEDRPRKSWSKQGDPFFTDREVYHGDAPSDLSSNHDKYLYDVDPHGLRSSTGN